MGVTLTTCPDPASQVPAMSDFQLPEPREQCLICQDMAHPLHLLSDSASCYNHILNHSLPISTPLYTIALKPILLTPYPLHKIFTSINQIGLSFGVTSRGPTQVPQIQAGYVLLWGHHCLPNRGGRGKKNLDILCICTNSPQ